MGSNNTHKNKNNPNQKPGLKHTMEEILERLRNGLEGIAEGLRPIEPQRIPIPIPIPTRGTRRR